MLSGLLLCREPDSVSSQKSVCVASAHNAICLARVVSNSVQRRSSSGHGSFLSQAVRTKSTVPNTQVTRTARKRDAAQPGRSQLSASDICRQVRGQGVGARVDP